MSPSSPRFDNMYPTTPILLSPRPVFNFSPPSVYDYPSSRSSLGYTSSRSTYTPRSPPYTLNQNYLNAEGSRNTVEDRRWARNRRLRCSNSNRSMCQMGGDYQPLRIDTILAPTLYILMVGTINLISFLLPKK